MKTFLLWRKLSISKMNLCTVIQGSLPTGTKDQTRSLSCLS
jgi:hypothetical protein